MSDYSQSHLGRFKRLLEEYDVKPSKKLGQNFLFNPNITDKIVQLAGSLEGRTVFEIGPGFGLLTQSLLKSQARKIIAIEKDKRTQSHLQTLTDDKERLVVIQDNALHVDLSKLSEPPRQIIANLPYNVATPLLINWLSQAEHFEQMLLMFQKEVGERICAQPNQKLYGRLSVISQWCADCTPVMHLSPESFYPKPAIWSVVVRIKPHKQQPSPLLFSIMENITKAAFGQRRKMLRGTLKDFCDGKLLEICNIDGRRRGETLSIEEFEKLALTVRDYEKSPEPL